MPSEQRDGGGTTIGAVTVVVASITPGANRVGFIEGWAVGRDTGSGDGALFRVASAGRTNGAGALAAIGAPATLVQRADASLAAATATLGGAGGAIELRVTGVPGRTIRWTGELTLHVTGA